MKPCPNCQATSFVDERCERCGRPLVADSDYFDEIERLAWEVVGAAFEEYGDEFSLGTSGDTPVERAIVRLGGRLRHYHYDGDGCLDEVLPSD